MGQSLSKNYIHLVVGTKHRVGYITPLIATKLHSYLSGILSNIESPAMAINSHYDHIHILFKLSKNMALAKAVEELKTQSSKWMKTQGVKDFYWQIGYGAFSVSYYKVDVIKKQIENQQIHHQNKTYKFEMENFMKLYNITEYNPEYFWR